MESIFNVNEKIRKKIIDYPVEEYQDYITSHYNDNDLKNFRIINEKYVSLNINGYVIDKKIDIDDISKIPNITSELKEKLKNLLKYFNDNDNEILINSSINTMLHILLNSDNEKFKNLYYRSDVNDKQLKQDITICIDAINLYIDIYIDLFDDDMAGGKNKVSYKKTDKKIKFKYNNKIMTRTIYINKRKTKYLKINKERILYSKIKKNIIH